ncbi:hypothetical protein K2173_028510 [Erythroxylum novogranatense]|uniref:Uncharacterized protein n=1 Tax=Erythroxylum novogranatense TaxID=1862640 RepID=A0AAV8U4V8_9ROSI|nr:hypothetical protein K2173_028510 [Erythroxylum novogranatense]
MTHVTSIKLSREFMIQNIHGCNRQRSGVIVKDKASMGNINFSSHGLRQDAWSLQVLSSIKGPINPMVTRYNVFVCQSVLTPGGGNEIPILKSATVVLTRTYNAVQGSPLLVKLIPALSIIAFSVWGLVPLIRLGRMVFLHKSDNSWKSSNTNYVITSYLQPLLLWSGATLICRVLDPVILPSQASQAVKQRVLSFVRSLATVLAFASCLSSLIEEAQKFFSDANDSDNARKMGISFAGKAVYTAVWVAAVSLFMELLGFSTQKCLTAGGLGTVLLTLAGREIFTNFLSSIMIHTTRPFVLNDWIQTKIEGYEVSGTVEQVGWWSPTVIRGDDREAVHIPNHKFSVSVVRNLSQKSHWRIKTHLAISHLDANKINNIVADMRKVLAKNPLIEQQRLHRRVFLENINPENQALMILISCFVKTSYYEEYMCAKEAVLMDLLRVVSHHRARLAMPIRTIQKVYSEPDLDNTAYADTIFSRSRAAVNRPLLLIEPSYKINGDDKVKASSRSTRTTDEKDEVEEPLFSDPKGDAKPSSTPNVDSKRETSASNTRKNSKVSLPTSDSQVNLAPDNVVRKKAEAQCTGRSTSTGTWQLNTEELTSEGGTAEKSIANSESSNDRSDTPSVISQDKQDAERSVASSSVGRPQLEENIVLGVALDGSKRTLPIEEEIPSSPFPVESKELASSRNGGGTSATKDKKDGQPTAAPNPAKSD